MIDNRRKKMREIVENHITKVLSSKPNSYTIEDTLTALEALMPKEGVPKIEKLVGKDIDKWNVKYKSTQPQELSVDEILDICEKSGGYYLGYTREDRKKALHDRIYGGGK